MRYWGLTMLRMTFASQLVQNQTRVVPHDAETHLTGIVATGEERTKHVFPMRRFLDADSGPQAHCTAGAADPMMWLHSQPMRTDKKGMSGSKSAHDSARGGLLVTWSYSIEIRSRPIHPKL